MKHESNEVAQPPSNLDQRLKAAQFIAVVDNQWVLEQGGTGEVIATAPTLAELPKPPTA